ncbi:RAMP superfamily CRISPR-associated protein [Thiolapillus sp.]
MITPTTTAEAMEIRNITVRFVTPAFLGNAEQSGQWRTPPFKHLLRECWRVVWMAEHGYNTHLEVLRKQEEHLFGAAANGQGNRSRLRLRLGRWEAGRLHTWPSSGRKVHHPKVINRQVDAGLYLGFGPLLNDNQKRTTILKKNAAIEAGEQAELKLAFPGEHTLLLDRALRLAHAYGTLGGRSRNGWGSLELEGYDTAGMALPLRPWAECLDRDWPHAIGSDDDGRPLIWRTEVHQDWQALMTTFAELKIGLRTQFPFRHGKDTQKPEPRHWLAYPVTNHPVHGWNNYRLPNSLRFKVRRGERGVYGVIFHMPHCPPKREREIDTSELRDIWRQVHDFLDRSEMVKRSDEQQ